MTTNQATNLVLTILGIAQCPTSKRNELKAFLELLMLGEKQDKGKSNQPKIEPNEIQPEENTINLADAFHFDFPKEFNLQVEGQEGTRKVKIFPDGVSESPAEKEE